MLRNIRKSIGGGLLTEIFVAGIIIHLLRGVLLPFVVAFGLAYVVAPLVNWIVEHSRLPRAAAVALLLIVFAAPLTFVGISYGPTLLQEAEAFARNIPTLITHIVNNVLGGRQLSIFGQQLSAKAISDQMIKWVESFLGTPQGVEQCAETLARVGMTGILTVVVWFYFVLDGAGLIARAVHLAPGEMRPRLLTILAKVDFVIGRFLRGLAVVVVFTATVVWLVFHFVFDLPYAPLFGIAIGLLELIPMIGPITSGILTSLAAFGHGGLLFTVKVILFYIMLRLTIDQVLAPVILGKAVVLPPVVVLFAFLAGGTLFGFLGLLIAVPTTAIFKVVAEELSA